MTIAMDQTKQLRRAIEHIRVTVPSAVCIELQTSDQGDYGFVLMDVITDDQQSVARRDPELFASVADDVFEYLCDLDWDGVVGENDQGHASIPLSEPEGEG